MACLSLRLNTGLGAMYVTKPSNFTWFGDINGPKPYEFIGFRWAFISQTPVSQELIVLAFVFSPVFGHLFPN